VEGMTPERPQEVVVRPSEMISFARSGARKSEGMGCWRALQALAKRKADTIVPSWTSQRRPTAFTTLGAQAVAPSGIGVRFAQCDLRAQLRVAIRGRT
jgi:hypothetical protein